MAVFAANGKGIVGNGVTKSDAGQVEGLTFRIALFRVENVGRCFGMKWKRWPGLRKRLWERAGKLCSKGEYL